MTIIPLDLILQAKDRLTNVAVRTPLIPLNLPVDGKKVRLSDVGRFDFITGSCRFATLYTWHNAPNEI